MSRRFGDISGGGGSKVVVKDSVLDPEVRINGLLGRRFRRPTDKHTLNSLTVVQLKTIAHSKGTHLTKCKGGKMVAVTAKSAIKKLLVENDDLFLSKSLHAVR